MTHTTALPHDPAEEVDPIERHAGMIPVFHEDHLAFCLTKRLDWGEIIQAGVVVLPDGHAPRDRTEIVCGTCLKRFDYTVAIARAQNA